MNVLICVGSSCHLKGSYDVIKAFQALVKEYGLEEKVTLSASFCMGHCTQGVGLKVDGEYVEGLTRDNPREIFEHHILAKLKQEPKGEV